VCIDIALFFYMYSLFIFSVQSQSSSLQFFILELERVVDIVGQKDGR